jgi:hypothetical protein
VCDVEEKHVPLMLLPAFRAAELFVTMFKDNIEIDIKGMALMTTGLKLI